MTRFTPLMLCVALIGAAACSGRSGPQFDRSDVENITKLIEQLKIALPRIRARLQPSIHRRAWSCLRIGH